MKNMNQSGRSMVEMLGVLAIIGVLSVGGIAGYSKAMNKYKINKTSDQVSMLVANIRTLFSSQGDYTGVDNASAIKFGVVPEDMYTVGQTTDDIKNAFGGAVVIKSSKLKTSTDTEDAAFTIAYKGLTKEACVTIATGDWGSGQGSGLVGVAAGADTAIEDAISAVYVGSSMAPVNTEGTIYAVPGAGAGKVSSPMPVAQAVLACNNDSNANAVAWKYY